MNKKVLRFGKNLICTLAIPVAAYIFLFAMCRLTGHSDFGVGADVQVIMYNSIYSTLLAMAMAINLTSGRFDFSVGATIILSVIVGGNIAKELELGAIGLLLVTMAIGALIGLVSGLVYTLLGLPPMVVSLGLAMIYEAIAFIFNSAKGVKLIGKNNMLVFSKMPWGIVVLIVVLIVMVVLWDFTRFGYNRKALISGQKIAVDVGVNEKRNALACYIIAGVLLGIAGCVYISKYGTMAPETGLGSSSYFMSAFLPIFIGGAIAKYSSQPIGICMGAITQALITSALVSMGCSSSLINVLNGVIVMVFLIYTSNSYVIELKKLYREKLEKAQKAAK